MRLLTKPLKREPGEVDGSHVQASTTTAGPLTHVRALLSVVSALRTRDLDLLLAAGAEALAVVMDFATVAINLRRPAFDDLQCAFVRGGSGVRAALLGTTTEISDWDPLLDPRFDRGGAFFIGHGDHDWHSDHVPAHVPDLPAPADPGGWHAEDALLLPLRASDDELLGIVSVDEPSGGRRPRDADLDVLVAVAAHVAVALEQLRATAEVERDRLAVQRLLEISARLAALDDPTTVLDLICDAVGEALGFTRVVIARPGGAGGLEPVASAGWPPAELAALTPITVGDLGDLLQRERQDCGYVLVSAAEARALVAPGLYDFFPSTRNGRGGRAWQRHWLAVPLRAPDGTLLGLLWPDEPADRLLPTPAKLRALRAFADQAVSALGRLDEA
jgi:GAF domain-containing protein